MNHEENLRIAWLFPSLERGNYWHPIFSKFTQKFPQTVIYTGYWAGFSPGFEDTFTVEVVGETKVISTIKSQAGYDRTYILPSLGIINHLLQHKPHVIFTSAFSIWTALALLLKLWFGWRVVVIFDGVSARTDHLNSGIRVFPRRFMSGLVDAFISNSQAGKSYLKNVIWVGENKIFAHPYLVPDTKILLQHQEENDSNILNFPVQQPVFLFVGQVIIRKGIQVLLQACAILNQRGYQNYTLLIVGDGAQREEFEGFAQAHHLQDCVKWIGQVDYHRLGNYFSCADVFVFPTLEDIWGMVVLEAMAFAKPVLCSKWAGAAEILTHGENGYLFDPSNVEELVEAMLTFFNTPTLVTSMGQKAQQLVAQNTSQMAAQLFCEVTSFVLKC